MMPDLDRYARIVVAFSGGKDSVASLCALLDAGANPDRIELWHHDVDGGEPLMDWPSTHGYVRALAASFSVPVWFSWRQGGFLREMLRENTPTAPISFESPEGVKTRGGRGKPNTRLRFPQVSADLTVRWCSGALKIAVADAALRNQERFFDGKSLFVTGERAEESPNRARYAAFEPHRTDTRRSVRRPRHVDHWRPVHSWTERDVWSALERYSVLPALPYQIGFHRLSCRSCIFQSADQAATLRHICPDNFEQLAKYERRFGCTIRRDIDLHGLADRGRPFRAALNRPDLVARAISDRWTGSVRLSRWSLPAGAFGEGDGPT
ncbi:phosphoadenosine phosphosulfate reductase [Komagataeibacter xylinus]|uniref:Phosphoadenosine phosphosulfate reductase n=1 Tax=Komagataeibacter xylinus TaxID=28448 RepID=A0A318PG36_KOMXY|nr:phosphoadenosine phosphosulfate reductase family protein [Komagataeibacter xylinus]PYD56191.1 phosphoadenosine phosphosulfate reductase [Komagataeibacter xylinus]